MDLSRHRMTALLALTAVVLQIVLAPNMQIGNALPNFVTSFVIAFALVRCDEPHFVLAFVMGLIVDLLGSTAVGLTSLCLLIASFAVMLVGRTVGSDNLVMSIVVILAAVFAIDVVYALFMVGNGVAGFSDAMLYRALPCTPYDATLGIIWYFVILHFSVPARGMGGAGRGSDTPNIRFS
jgi:rod shape-determining protein MreD